MELGARVRLTSHEVLTAVEKRRRRSRVSLSEVKLHICGAGNDGRVVRLRLGERIMEIPDNYSHYTIEGHPCHYAPSSN